MSSEASASMATTHFEVIGVIGVDKVGIRHFKRSEVANNFAAFDGIVK